MNFWSLYAILITMIRLKKIPENIYQKMGPLTDLLMNDPQIIFAYLFGGLVRERLNPLSDVDLPVFVRTPKKLEEFCKIGKF